MSSHHDAPVSVAVDDHGGTEAKASLGQYTHRDLHLAVFVDHRLCRFPDHKGSVSCDDTWLLPTWTGRMGM